MTYVFYKCIKGDHMDTQKTILIEVALETGFNDQSHFTHTFKRYAGVTPKQYAKK